MRELQLVLESNMVAQLWSRPWLPPLRTIQQDLQRLHRLGRRGTACRTPHLLFSPTSPVGRRKDLALRHLEEPGRKFLALRHVEEEPVVAAVLLTRRQTWHSKPHQEVV